MNDDVLQVDNREDVNKNSNCGDCDSLDLPFIPGPDDVPWSEENPCIRCIWHAPVPPTIVVVHQGQTYGEGHPKSNRNHRPTYAMCKSIINRSLQFRTKGFVSSDPFRNSEVIGEGCKEEVDEREAGVDSEEDDMTPNIFKLKPEGEDEERCVRDESAVNDDSENVRIEQTTQCIPFTAEVKYNIKEAQLNQGHLRHLKIGDNVKEQ